MARPQVPDELASEAIADAIVEIADAVKRLRGGKLNDRCLILLISHSSGQSQGAVRAVLGGIEGMKAYYLKKGAA